MSLSGVTMMYSSPPRCSKGSLSCHSTGPATSYCTRTYGLSKAISSQPHLRQLSQGNWSLPLTGTSYCFFLTVNWPRLPLQDEAQTKQRHQHPTKPECQCCKWVTLGIAFVCAAGGPWPVAGGRWPVAGGVGGSVVAGGPRPVAGGRWPVAGGVGGSVVAGGRRPVAGGRWPVAGGVGGSVVAVAGELRPMADQVLRCRRWHQRYICLRRSLICN